MKTGNVLANVLDAYDKYISNVVRFGHTSCDVRFVVLHTKNCSDYRLLGFFGFFTNDTFSPVTPLESCNLENNQSAKVFQAVFSTSDLRTLIQSCTNNHLKLPGCTAPHDAIIHSLNLKQDKPITYLPADERTESTLNFLPDPGAGLHIFELFSTSKNALDQISAADIDKIDRMLSKHVEFSILTHSARVGNLLLAANLESIKVDFKGDGSNGIRIRLLPRSSRFAEDDFVLTVMSDLMGETTGSAVKHPVKRSMHIQGIHSGSLIDARLWQISKSALVARNFGKLFGGNVTVHTSTQKNLRVGKLRNSDGTIRRTATISTFVPLGCRQKTLPHWTSQVREQVQKAQKIRLIREKKLLHYVNGEHGKAIEDIIDLINSIDSDTPLKIWDPYVGEYYLDFLSFMKSERSIRVISEMRTPPDPSEDVRRFGRFTRASENFILDFQNRFPRKLIELIKKRQRDRAAANKKSALLKMTNYLNELRSSPLNLEFRYQEGGKGFPFHDRFIIGGGKCWSLGSSLNHIGNKHCVIIEIQYPEIIEHEFDRLWDLLHENSL